MGQAIFSTSGAHIWTVPSGVATVNVLCVGGGGGGGGPFFSTGGGGGGGGAAAQLLGFDVTGFPSWDLEVGAGGPAGSDGGDSTFNSVSCRAAGGDGTIGTFGGAGGQTVDCIGDSRTAGGDGGSGFGAGGGGGGGGSGASGAGGTGGNSSGGTGGGGGTPGSGGGGAGGAGGDTDTNGDAGTPAGGGGGGGGDAAGNGNQGATGVVVISWADPPTDVLGPGALVLDLTLYGPTILSPSADVLGPDALVLDLTLYGPTVVDVGPPVDVLGPDALVLDLTLYGPAIAEHDTLGPDALVLDLTLYGPAIAEHDTLGPDALVLDLTLYPPVLIDVHAEYLGPDALVLVLTLYPPSVEPFVPCDCWRMYRDGGSGNWILDGGCGLVVYTMSGTFQPFGTNRFDILISTKTTDPVPDYIDVSPYSDTGCPCGEYLGPLAVVLRLKLYPPSISGGALDPCCSSLWPFVIYAHITGHGACACLSGSTVPMAQDPLTGVWSGDLGSPTPCGGTPFGGAVIGLYCAPDVGCPTGNNWVATTAGGIRTQCEPTGPYCATLSLTFTGFNGFLWGCGGVDPGDTYDITFDLLP